MLSCGGQQMSGIHHTILPVLADCPGLPAAASRQQTALTVIWPAPEHDGEQAIMLKFAEPCLCNSLGTGLNLTGAPCLTVQCTSHRAPVCLLLFAAGGAPITSYRLEMCCLGGVEGGRGEGGKGKVKVDPPFELAYLGPERTAGGWGH